MRVTTDAIEIRGKEVKVSKKNTEYLIVRAEDETGKIYELCDRNMDRKDEYTKGLDCRLVLDIQMGKYTNIEIVGIEEV